MNQMNLNPLKFDAKTWIKLYTWLYWASCFCTVLNAVLWMALHMKIHLYLTGINVLSVAICELVLRLMEKQEEHD